MSNISNIHSGDIGTIFQAEIQDEDALPFDPTAAVTKSMIFKLPVSGIIITRPASVTTAGVGLKQKWFLQYAVVVSDITAGLNNAPGLYSWQGELIFGDGSTYHTNVITYQVYPNLF